MFPSAGSSCDVAIANYKRYCKEEHVWILRWLVIPAAELEHVPPELHGSLALLSDADESRAAVIEAGAKTGEPVAIFARNGPGVVVASYGVMASGAAEFVVDLNLGPDDVSYATGIMGVRRAVVERSELPRVASLNLDVMVLEDIVARPRLVMGSQALRDRLFICATTGLYSVRLFVNGAKTF